MLAAENIAKFRSSSCQNNQSEDIKTDLAQNLRKSPKPPDAGDKVFIFWVCGLQPTAPL